MCKPLVRSFGAVIKYDCWKPTAKIYRKNELYHFREKLGGLVFLEYLFSTAFFDRPLEVRGRYADRIITSYIILSGFCVQNDNNRCIQIIIYLALVQISVQLRGLLEASVDSVSVKKHFLSSQFPSTCVIRILLIRTKWFCPLHSRGFFNAGLIK